MVQIPASLLDQCRGNCEGNRPEFPAEMGMSYSLRIGHAKHAGNARAEALGIRCQLKRNVGVRVYTSHAHPTQILTGHRNCQGGCRSRRQIMLGNFADGFRAG
jgi:hypothetical protein